MHVVATAGHVDHGKSTLIRALTGMEPDRWAEERRRGLTIDLGYAWTELPAAGRVGFVDVPGHERFLGNMLAGLGPAPVVCFVVAADEGWRAQSGDHRDAVAALGIEHGLIVVTRADRAQDGGARAVAQARDELAGTGLRDAPASVVSAVTGAGLVELRTALGQVLAAVPAPDPAGRLRLWVDRSFTITGAGTVVTGTLAAGTIAVGDTVRLAGAQRRREVQVRGLQSYGQAQQVVGPTARVAVNLRGVPADQVRRGDVLLAGSGADWPATASIDVRRVTGAGFGAVPQRVTAHVGTAAITARLRPFDDEHARLTLDHAVPLGVGDRIVLRGPGSRRVLGGVLVLDVDPPPLQRRGDGARRAGALAVMSPAADLVSELSRRGAVTDRRLRELGVLAGPAGGEGDPVPAGVRRWGGWWVHEDAVAVWTRRLAEAVAEAHDRDPLTGLPRSAAAALLGLPDGALVDEVARAAGVDQDGGRLRPAGTRGDLGPAEAAVAALERRLADAPFRAPEADDLNALELGPRELAAAERAGRILRLADGVVLLPGAPDLAVRRLAGLPQPFTTSQARQVLESTRRVVIPLLEHLDAAGATRRIDAGHRQLVNRDTGGG